MGKLRNKTVFITGGLSGIGHACALAAAAEGADIVIADLPSSNVDGAMAAVTALNAAALFVECDVADYAQVHTAVQKTVSTFGGLHIGLNNAGIGGDPGKTGEMTERVWQRVININLNGVFNCMRHQLHQMALQQSGIIVNMSSILGKVGFATSCHYAAAKHGIIGLTQTAAVEYAAEGIRINAICPAFIETPLLEKAGISGQAEMKQHITNLHPMKRLGRPEEIAAGFIFLASDDSSFMTGATLDIDGGYLAV